MRLFWKKKEASPEEYMARLVEALANEKQTKGYGYDFKLGDSKTGQEIQALKPDQARLFVLAVIAWLDPFERHQRKFTNATYARVRSAMFEILRRKLPFTEADVVELLDWSLDQDSNYSRGLVQMIRVIENYLKQQEMTPVILERIRVLADYAGSGYVGAEDLRYQARLRELGQVEDLTLALIPGEAWTDAVSADIAACQPDVQRSWLVLFQVCAHASGSSPSAKWQKMAEAAVDSLTFEYFKPAVLHWFALFDSPRTGRAKGANEHPLGIHPVNSDILRALVWICAAYEDRELARGLTTLAISAYRKIPGIGPRAPKVGNACIWALGNMPGVDGVHQLALLKLRVKFTPAQKGIESSLQMAAERLGLPADEIEELSVPAYGLVEVGLRRETLGDYVAEIRIEGSQVELGWWQSGGKKLASAPKALKEVYGEELKELTQAKKDIEKMLPAQTARIENLYLSQKTWKMPVWRERYLDHPLVGSLARRLIWKFSTSDRAASGIWWQEQVVGKDAQPLTWLDDETTVELWHPIFAEPETILSWRAWLEEHQVRQPFKQAHREVYLLTDAECQTRVYSNRYAAHIIKQHQFNALCGQRGWKNKLRLMVDDEYPPAERLLPKWNLRAEFWVEGAGDNNTDSGTYLYLATDQVRFYHIDAAENYAHALGGGYASRRQAVQDPIDLEAIPALVFSEIMRDVDLFIGVASIGNDPAWVDGGSEPRYTNYWSGYSFGELSETAKTRKQILERLVPRLKIGQSCSFNDRFLIVRGDLNTYKIHLGSGNIQMEPGNQYLCIVPARGTGSMPSDRLFLPFEGDQTLSIILSKAFLLAEDMKITDPTITQQIRR